MSQLEIARWSPASARGAPILLLHEGLGSVSMWRDFPAALAEATGREVIAYSRHGHGRSPILTAPREPDYMHVEAEVALPALLDQLGLDEVVLFGHSDGASIALIYAALPDSRATALVLEAPHVFVEDLSHDSIAKLRPPETHGVLVEKLGRHHTDAAATFKGWNDIWLDPRFRSWNIEDRLQGVKVPALLIQGEDDEYGTRTQLDTIVAATPASEILLLDHCGHAPHRDHRDAVLEATARFLELSDAIR
jgi:pimeloyl-ACP methyl ester carboxylesterase